MAAHAEDMLSIKNDHRNALVLKEEDWTVRMNSECAALQEQVNNFLSD